MKTKIFGLIAGLLVCAMPLARAATNDISALLQKGLLEEEANRNLEAAARVYQDAIAQFDQDRKLAATAVFRLGEVYRKLGRTNEARVQYERVVTEFPDQATLVGQSQNYLRAAQPAARLATVVPRSGAITSEEAEEIKRIQSIIQNSPDLINAPAPGGTGTPLYRAAAAGQLVVAQFLLDNGAQISSGVGGDTPLHAAAQNGHKAMVELLLDRGADVNAPGNNGLTPLHIAAARGYSALAETLLAHGAKVNASTPNGQTPLHDAVKLNRSELVRLLLAHKADVNAADKEGLTPLHLAVRYDCSPAIVELLVANGADVNAKSNQGTPLFIAAERGNKEMIELLLAKGADVKAGDARGNTPLHMLVHHGLADMAKVFLAKGANPNAADKNGSTLLHLAAMLGRDEIATVLIEAGANVHAETAGEKWRPLHYATQYGRKEIAALLIKHGADMNAKNSNGHTPLDLVQAWGIKKAGAVEGVSRAAMIEFLHENGGRSQSNPPSSVLRSSIQNRYGLTPRNSFENKGAAAPNFPGRPVIDGIVYSPDAKDSKLIAAGFTPAPSAHPKVMDVWEPCASANLLSGRSSHSVVWTGKELIVFGGEGMGVSFGDGARYDFAKNEWRELPKENSPSTRTTHTAVWTSKEMIIWGGFGGSHGNDTNRNDGGQFDPTRNTWKPVSTKNAPEARFNHTAVWTGREMLVWGGFTDSRSWYQGGWNDAHLNTGGRYDPARDEWKEIPNDGAPSKRFNHVAVWTGKEMIVWGGGDTRGALNDGGRFNPATGKWKPVSTKNAPGPRAMPVAVWTGREMIVWGGGTREQSSSQAGYFTDGGRYNPETDTWKRISAEDIEKEFPGRVFAMAAWTGSEMIIWGGVNDAQANDVGDHNRYLNSGARYNPATDRWTAMTTEGAPPARLTRGVWAGDNLLLFGGYAGTHLNDTWLYSPQKTLYPYSLDGSGAFQIRRVLETPGENSEELTVSGADASEKLHVEKTILLDASAIAGAEFGGDKRNPSINVQFTDSGKAKFARITREHVGKRLAIVVNGVVWSAPMIATEIANGRAVIAGKFSVAEAEELVELLNAAAAQSSSGKSRTQERWRDAGAATPEAAIETFFWATREQNAERFWELIYIREVPVSDRLIATLKAEARLPLKRSDVSRIDVTGTPKGKGMLWEFHVTKKDGGKAVGRIDCDTCSHWLTLQKLCRSYEILAQTGVDSDTATVRLAFVSESGERDEDDMELRQFDGAWRWVMPGKSFALTN